jgi:hypothetical protein
MVNKLTANEEDALLQIFFITKQGAAVFRQRRLVLNAHS